MSKSRALSIALVAAACVALAAPASAGSRTIIVNSRTNVVANNVVIKSSGGVTVVDAGSICSAGVSGYLFQSVAVWFGGGWFFSAQSKSCP